MQAKCKTQLVNNSLANRDWSLTCIINQPGCPSCLSTQSMMVIITDYLGESHEVFHGRIANEEVEELWEEDVWNLPAKSKSYLPEGVMQSCH